MNLSTENSTNCIILKTKTNALNKNFPESSIKSSTKYISGKKPETWYEVSLYFKNEEEYNKKMDELKKKKLDRFIICHFSKK